MNLDNIYRFKTSLFRLLDTTDTTKQMAVDVSAITTGTTRTLTMPDNDVDLGTMMTNVLTDGAIWIGNGSNVATAITPSGDVTISNTGVTTIGANKVTFAKMQTAGQNNILARTSAGTGDIEARNFRRRKAYSSRRSNSCR